MLDDVDAFGPKAPPRLGLTGNPLWRKGKIGFLARSALTSIVSETCPGATQQRTASSEQRAAMGSLETRASKGACVTERQGWHECLRRIQAASQSAAAGIQTSCGILSSICGCNPEYPR